MDVDDNQQPPAELKQEASETAGMDSNAAEAPVAAVPEQEPQTTQGTRVVIPQSQQSYPTTERLSNEDVAETETQTPADPNGEVSVNPLDAPKSPPAQDEPEAEQEDAEMAGVDEDPKIEDVDAEKDVAEDSQETPA